MRTKLFVESEPPEENVKCKIVFYKSSESEENLSNDEVVSFPPQTKKDGKKGRKIVSESDSDETWAGSETSNADTDTDDSFVVKDENDKLDM